MNPGASEQDFADGVAVFRGLDEEGRRSWIKFQDPLMTAVADTVEAVRPALRTVDEAIRKGLFAAGYVAYEAASAFDPECKTRPPVPFERRIKLSEWGLAETTPQQRPASLPVVWFGIYETFSTPSAEELFPGPEEMLPPLRWENRMKPELFKLVLQRVRDYVARGDCHRLPYLLRFRAAFEGGARTLLRDLYGSRRTPYAACLSLPGFEILSASPELFFGLAGDRLFCRPVLAGSPRAPTWEEDVTRAELLKANARTSPEAAATTESVLGRLEQVARKGSIATTALFDIERSGAHLYLASMLEASTEAAVGDLVAAMFPPASATGAPRARAMEIIAELETAPRGVFSGCLGFAGPRSPFTGAAVRSAQFSMAHGAIVVDRGAGTAEMGAASHLGRSSDPARELAGALHQVNGIAPAPASFGLYESILWQPERGYYLLDLHMQRLANSAMYFGFPLSVREVLAQLADITRKFYANRHLVRVNLDEAGRVTLQSEENHAIERVWKVALAPSPVHSSNIFLYHQTTRREPYDEARAARPDADDVILWNERGEVTEATAGSLLVRLNGSVITPPLTSGLLPGVYRRYLLDRKEVAEAVVRKEDLAAAEGVFLVNSLRDWVRVNIVP